MSAPAYRLFIDSAATADWKRLAPLGLFHGVTTNPTLLARAGVPCTEDALEGLAEAAAKLKLQEVQLQTWGETEAQLHKRGIRLAAFDRKRVVVKVPAVAAGFATAARLASNGVRVTMTAVYSPAQALACAAFGAAYAAPYFGRMLDAGQDAAAVVAAMRAVLRTGADRTRLLVASLRTPGQVASLAAAGCDTFTMAPALAEMLLADEASVAATAVFEAAAKGPAGSSQG